MDTTNERALRRSDYFLLTLLCAVLFGIAIIDERILTTHEATHCENVREMFANGEYLIPTYGNRPWLERPPVPHWLTGIVAVAVADPAQPWAMRLGSVLFGTFAVLIWGWAIAGALGRHLGMISAAVLATMREWFAYATGPEADIYLASFVTLAGALFIRAEFSPTGAKPEQPRFFGNRPWPIWGFFLVLGCTNAMKGPLFGTAFLGVSLSVYFLWGQKWQGLLRYVWCWGWLAYLVVGLAWPVFAYQYHPDVADVWRSDYGKRWNTNYIGEPFWYYFAIVPWNWFPWTLPVAIGLGVTYRQAWRERQGVWLFLGCWAIVPPLVFSLFKGKHHHYMLNCIAPQATLGACGAVALWRAIAHAPRWLRSPLFGLAVGVLFAVLMFVFAHKIPGPTWLVPTFALGCVVLLPAVWYFVGHRCGQTALISFLSIVTVVHITAYVYRSHYLTNYTEDMAWLRESVERVPPGTTIYVLNESHALNAAWLLYYVGPQAHLLHNITFLASDRITDPAIYLIARRSDAAKLEQFGTPTPLITSVKTRAESSPEDRYTLFMLTFDAKLQRQPEPPVNGMEATGRKDGPFLSIKKE